LGGRNQRKIFGVMPALFAATGEQNRLFSDFPSTPACILLVHAAPQFPLNPTKVTCRG
jgi:hypothetical protein